MSTMHWPERVAVGLGGLSAVGVLWAASSHGRSADEVLSAAVLPLGFFAMGAVAAALRSGHGVGHRLLAVGVLHLLAVVGSALASGLGGRAAASMMGACSAVLFAAGFVGLLDLLLRFPSGDYALARGRLLVRGAALVTGIATILAVLGSRAVPNVIGLPMPESSMYLEPLAPLEGAFAVALLLPLVGVVLLVARYRSSPLSDREQMRWPIGAALLVVVGIATTGLVERALGASAQTAVFVAAALVFPASFLIGLLRHGQEMDRLADLEASRERLARAAAEERRRIERDLHDGAQQQLIALLSQVETARIRAGADGPHEELDRIAAGIRQTHHDLRSLAHGIHPAVLSDHGLAEAVRVALARSTADIQLRVDPRVEARRYPDHVELTAYLVVLEGLANAGKHAPGAAVSVLLAGDAGALCVTVRDDGPGLGEPLEGSGLDGLRDRLATVGGSLAVHSRPGDGTTLTATLPVTASVSDA